MEAVFEFMAFEKILPHENLFESVWTNKMNWSDFYFSLQDPSFVPIGDRQHLIRLAEIQLRLYDQVLDTLF